MKTVVVINGDQMGHGDRELGRKLLATCLRKLGNSKDVEAIVLSSDVHEERMWEKRGVFESRGIPVVRLYGAPDMEAVAG